MKLGPSALIPSHLREPSFRTMELEPTAYQFLCINCRTSIVADYDQIIKALSHWEEEWDDEAVADAKEHFGIGAVGKSPDGGWPSMLILDCRICGTKHLIYSGVNEFYNSMYDVTVQGIAEIIEV